MLRYLPLAFAVTLGGAGAAIAQADPLGQARQSAYNQVGIMEYCHSKGYADDAAVSSQRATLARLPPGPVTPDLTAAEATGKGGAIASPNGTKTTLSEMASKTNTTEAALCGRMVDSAKQVNSSMTANGLSGGMPAMPPGMPAMPTMPTMSGMPSMSGMPAMPGAPPAR